MTWIPTKNKRNFIFFERLVRSRPPIYRSCSMCQTSGKLYQVVEIHPNIIERQCLINERGIMDIFSGALFYIYIANMSAKALPLPKHTIVASLTKGLICIVNAWSDDSDTRRKSRLENTAYAGIESVDINKRTLPMKTRRIRPLQSQNIDIVVNSVD